MDATKTTTNEKAPALSPADLAEELMSLADDAVPWRLKGEVEEAERALAAVRAKVDRAGEKKLRILRAKSVEEAKAILAENPADVNLKKLCQRLSGWKPLQENGATDEEIKALLTKRPGGWPDYRPHPHAMPSASGGYGSPSVWVDPDKGAEGKPHLEGQKLVDAVRRVMSIPKPAAPTKPPAAKKSAPAKKGNSKAPAPAAAAKAPADGGSDDDDAGGAAKASAATVAPARFVVGPDGKQRMGHRQTWGQWAATLRGIPGGPDLSPGLETKLDPTAQERFFLEQFLKGARPADARDAWSKAMAVEKSLAAPPAGSDEAEAERFGNHGPKAPAPVEPPPVVAAAVELVPGRYYDADRLGLTPDALEASLAATAIYPPGNPNDGNPAPSPARVGKPLKVADRFWAAVGASVEHRRVTYQLAPLIPEGETIRLYEDFDDLREDHVEHGRGKDKAPEEYDLDGLGVVDPQNLRWVVGADEIYLRVPRDPAAEASKAAQAAHDKALAEGKSFGEAVNAGTLALAEASAAAADDPNVDGRGVFVGGVREVWVTGTAKGDGAKIVIRVAKGADELYRTGYLLAFPGAEAWHADPDEPVKWYAQGADTEAYAIRTRAQKLIGTIRAAPGGAKGGAWTAEQRRVYGAAIKALESFVESNPACREPAAPAKAG